MGIFGKKFGRGGRSPSATFRFPDCGSVYQVGVDANLCAMDLMMGDMTPMLGLLFGALGAEGHKDAPDAVHYHDCTKLSAEDVREMKRHVTTAANAVKGGASRWWKCDKCEKAHGYKPGDVGWFL